MHYINDYDLLYKQLIFRYILKFRVNDKKHSQSNIPANVSVTVKNIPYEAVINSGSIRISGLTDEEFVKIWHYDVSMTYI